MSATGNIRKIKCLETLTQADSTITSDKFDPPDHTFSAVTRAERLIYGKQNIYLAVVLVHKERSFTYGVNTLRYTNMALDAHKSADSLRRAYNRMRDDKLVFLYKTRRKRTNVIFRVLKTEKDLAYRSASNNTRPFWDLTQEERMDFMEKLQEFFPEESGSQSKNNTSYVKEYPIAPTQKFSQPATSFTGQSMENTRRTPPPSTRQNVRRLTGDLSGDTVMHKQKIPNKYISPSPYPSLSQEKIPREREKKKSPIPKQKYQHDEKSQEGIEERLQAAKLHPKLVAHLLDYWIKFRDKDKKFPAGWLISMLEGGHIPYAGPRKMEDEQKYTKQNIEITAQCLRNYPKLQEIWDWKRDKKAIVTGPLYEHQIHYNLEPEAFRQQLQKRMLEGQKVPGRAPC